MSDTPFTDRFQGDKKLIPGIWWHVSYSVKTRYGVDMGSQEFKFNGDPTTITIEHVDYVLKALQEQNEHVHIIILSWSKFTVPETHSDV